MESERGRIRGHKRFQPASGLGSPASAHQAPAAARLRPTNFSFSGRFGSPKCHLNLNRAPQQPSPTHRPRRKCATWRKRPVDRACPSCAMGCKEPNTNVLLPFIRMNDVKTSRRPVVMARSVVFGIAVRLLAIWEMHFLNRLGRGAAPATDP